MALSRRILILPSRGSVPAGRRLRRRTGVGYSLVEILVTLSIMGVLASSAGLYYQNVLPEQRIGRAKTDIQQYKKAVGYLKDSYKAGPLSSDAFRYIDDGPTWSADSTRYRTWEPPDADPGLEKLLKFGIVSNLVQDPWGGDYRINVQHGWIYSQGPDPGTTADDVIDAYEPEFGPVRARLGSGGVYVDVEFSREMSRKVLATNGTVASVLSTANFAVIGPSSASPVSLVTATLDFSSPFVVRLKLPSLIVPSQITVYELPPAGPAGIYANNLLRSADNAVLSVPRVVLATSPTSGGLYLPQGP